MSSSLRECRTTADCAETIDGRTVLKQCYLPEDSNETGVCDCPNWFGFSGDSCEDVTPMVLYNRAKFLLFVALAGPLCLWISVKLIIFLRSRKMKLNLETVAQQQQKAATKIQGVFVAICCIIATFLVCFHAISSEVAMFHTQNFGLATRKSATGMKRDEEIQAFPTRFSEESLVLAFSCFLLASLQISVSWISLTEKITIVDKPAWEKRLIHVRFVAWMFSIFYVVLAIVCLMAGYVYAVSIISGLISILLLLLFIFGMKAIKMTLNALPSNCSSATSKARRMIHISSSGHILALIIMIIALMVHANVGNVFHYNSPPGKFNGSVVSRDIIVICGVFLVALDAWYIDKVFDGLKDTSSRSKSSFVTQHNGERQRELSHFSTHHDSRTVARAMI